MMNRVAGLALIFATMALTACSRTELSSAQEAFVAQCIRLAIDENVPPDCMDVSHDMEEALLRKYPTFKEDYLKELQDIRENSERRLRQENEARLKAERDQRLRMCASAVLSKDDGLIKHRCGEFSQTEIGASVESKRHERAEAERAEHEKYRKP